MIEVEGIGGHLCRAPARVTLLDRKLGKYNIHTILLTYLILTFRGGTRLMKIFSQSEECVYPNKIIHTYVRLFVSTYFTNKNSFLVSISRFLRGTFVSNSIEFKNEF